MINHEHNIAGAAPVLLFALDAQPPPYCRPTGTSPYRKLLEAIYALHREQSEQWCPTAVSPARAARAVMVAVTWLVGRLMDETACSRSRGPAQQHSAAAWCYSGAQRAGAGAAGLPTACECDGRISPFALPVASST